jgi:hypothetical protein
LTVKEKYGAERVPLAFLFQGLPPLLLSNWLARLTPEHKMKTVFVLAQFAGILALSFLHPEFGMTGILLFIFINSTIQTLTNPILISLAMHTVGSSRWQEVHTRLTSVQASTMALAPIFGGWFSMTFSFVNLIWLTAACRLIGAAILVPAIPPIEMTTKSVESLRWFQQWRPLRIPNEILRGSILKWSLFLVCGAFLNTIEFPMFELQGLSRSEIGWMLGAWGVGNLAAFFASSKLNSRLNLQWSAAFFIVALTLFVLSTRFEPALLAFLFGGFLNSYVAGILRNKISQSIPEQIRSLDVWAAVNQRMSLINIAIYGIGGYLLASFSPQILGIAMIVCGLLLVASVRNPKFISSRIDI